MRWPMGLASPKYRRAKLALTMAERYLGRSIELLEPRSSKSRPANQPPPSVEKKPGETGLQWTRRSVGWRSVESMIDRQVRVPAAAGEERVPGDCRARDARRCEPPASSWSTSRAALGPYIRSARVDLEHHEDDRRSNQPGPSPCRRDTVCTKRPAPIRRISVNAICPTTSARRRRTPPPLGPRSRSAATRDSLPACSAGARAAQRAGSEC